MQVIEKQQINELLSYQKLIATLEKGFAKKYHMPPRQVFELNPGDPSHNAFAVLPAWNEDVIGVKAFTYFPDNGEKGLESLYSKIMLFSRPTGEPLALLDGTSITFWRTACVSALASMFLSKKSSNHLFLLGTGNLAPYIIKAHLAVRNITKVSVWGRDGNKAQSVIDTLSKEYSEVTFEVEKTIESSARQADIICCATGSGEPLILGDWLKKGAHLDLIGNHHADKRECDELAVTKAKVYVDSKANVLKEAGELLIPIAEGKINNSHVKGELADLCRGGQGRADENEITLFKSVGTALSDLIAAHYVYRCKVN